MDYAVLDFETFYSKDFSLSKMQTDAYVLDGRFQIIGVAVKSSVSAEVQWFTGSLDETKAFLQRTIDWSKPVCAHNTLFDGFICERVLGLHPAMWLDTLGMGRAAYPWLPSHSLSSMASYFGVGQKGHEVVLAEGKRLEDFTPAELARYGEYCKNDVGLTAMLAELLLERTPPLELKIIDMCIRMFTRPALLGDAQALEEYYHS